MPPAILVYVVGCLEGLKASLTVEKEALEELQNTFGPVEALVRAREKNQESLVRIQTLIDRVTQVDYLPEHQRASLRGISGSASLRLFDVVTSRPPLRLSESAALRLFDVVTSRPLDSLRWWTIMIQVKIACVATIGPNGARRCAPPAHTTMARWKTDVQKWSLRRRHLFCSPATRRLPTRSSEVLNGVNVAFQRFFVLSFHRAAIGHRVMPVRVIPKLGRFLCHFGSRFCLSAFRWSCFRRCGRLFGCVWTR
jgi:hypothetical protein